MNILIITSRVPYPLTDGGAIQGYANAVGYVAQGHSVAMLALSTHKHPAPPAHTLPAAFAPITLHTTPADTRVRFFDAFFNLFTKKSYNIVRFFDKNADAMLKNLLQTNHFDLIHLESPFVGDYLPTLRHHAPHATVVLRTHNAEHIIWQRMAQKTRNFLLKYYYNLCAKRLYIYEKKLLNSVDAVVAITQNDKDIFIKMGCQRPIFVSPAGADITQMRPNFSLPQSHALCFIASLDWLPNIEGLDWFLKEIWHKIQQKQPNITLHIGGRNMPDRIKKINLTQIKIHPNISNAHDYMHKNGILIVPLLSGSGMRLKIIEAMALGKAIITTTIGAEGIDIMHKTHLYIADTPQEFADACLLLLHNETLAQTLGKNAHAQIKNHYSHQNINTELSNFYKSIKKL